MERTKKTHTKFPLMISHDFPKGTKKNGKDKKKSTQKIFLNDFPMIFPNGQKKTERTKKKHDFHFKIQVQDGG